MSYSDDVMSDLRVAINRLVDVTISESANNKAEKKEIIDTLKDISASLKENNQLVQENNSLLKEMQKTYVHENRNRQHC
jgi:ribonuclease HI